jgi:hypothetical protein
VTTLNAKANAAYHELIAETLRENPGDVWVGFEHEREAFETGWEAGHEAAQPVVDQEAVAKAAVAAILYNLPIDAFGDQKRLEEYAAIWGNAAAKAVLALVNGGAK